MCISFSVCMTPSMCGRMWRGKASFCWLPCLCSSVMHLGIKTLSSSHPSSFVSPLPFAVLTHQFFLSLFTSLPLFDPFTFPFFCTVFLWFVASYTFFPSCFNLDFHLTSLSLSPADVLSFYFFWWQSLFFTSPSLCHPFSASLRCFSLSPAPLAHWLGVPY